MGNTIKLAEYIFMRIRQLGIKSIHGVPGDYNLTLLDYVEPAGLHWVGSCNELNAGYATDAYSRINGVGALITTFGVGELSAINAIAGAYAELAPVIHIVGTPTREQHDSRALIHHTLNDGEYGRFARMHKEVTIAQAELIDPRTCTQLFDNTIRQCLLHSRPVYIQVPVDMVNAQVPAEPLQTPLHTPPPPSTEHFINGVDAVLQRMYSSERPMILVDGESRAYGILDHISQLVQSTKWPTWTSVFGKGLVDESFPNVHGVWKGKFGSAEHAEYVKTADLILCFGPHFSGTNTYMQSTVPDPSITILLGQTSIKVGSSKYRDLPAGAFLDTLMKQLDLTKLHTTSSSDLFFRIFQDYVREGDIVLAETGSAGVGCRDVQLPSNTRFFTAATWLSIGYMLPASQGAALAQRDQHESSGWKGLAAGKAPRTILMIGDGSLQMTVQELGTIIREKLNVLVIVLNNDGYTIERCIHGWNKHYNDIARWQYTNAPALFGASNDEDGDYPALTAKVKTWGELKTALDHQTSIEKPAFRMVEVIMDKEDCVDIMKSMMEQSKARK